MLPDKLIYPAIFHDGHFYLMERSDVHTGSYFGGPIEESINGIEHGPDKLHHIATFNGKCFEPLWHIVGCSTLPLLYGMRYDGCQMKYKYSGAGLEILEMMPTTSAKDWPYVDYPTYLPYFPLRLKQRSKCSMEEFLKLSCQPIEVGSSEALILIPPSPVLGMSLWGPSGDMENVQIVFRCNLSSQTIETYNQCG